MGSFVLTSQSTFKAYKWPFLGKMLLHTSSFLEENDRPDSLIRMFTKVWSNRVLNI